MDERRGQIAVCRGESLLLLKAFAVSPDVAIGTEVNQQFEIKGLGSFRAER